MALRSNSFEGGSNNTTFTQGSGGNTGGSSGDYFDLVGTGDVQQFSTVQHASGTLSGRFATRASTATAHVDWTTQHGNIAQEFGRFYFLTDTAPSATVNIVILYEGFEAAARVTFDLTTTLKFRLTSQGIGSNTFATTLSLNTWYRMEWHWDPVAQTVTANLYLGDSTTVLESQNRADVTASANCGAIRFGQLANVANIPSSTGFFYYDNLVSGAAAFPGPAVSTGGTVVAVPATALARSLMTSIDISITDAPSSKSLASVISPSGTATFSTTVAAPAANAPADGIIPQLGAVFDNTIKVVPAAASADAPVSNVAAESTHYKRRRENWLDPDESSLPAEREDFEQWDQAILELKQALGE